MLDIAINGWFAGHAYAGSGQYIDHMLAWIPRVEPQARISLLLPQPGQSRDVVTRWPGVDPVHVPVPPLPRNLAKLWWEQVAVPQAARKLGADVLWVPYWAAPWWQPVPTVVTVHDLIPLLLPEYRGGALQRLYTRLAARTAKRAAAVITVSAAGARDVVAHLGIPPERVFPIPHGPNQEGDSVGTDVAAVRRKYNLPERYFLYLGGFDVRKNVAGVLAAYQRYLQRGGDPAVKLVIGGRLPQAGSAFAPDPQTIAAELRLAEAVHFCGYVDEQDKPLVYALAVAYLFPSRYEGFGMTVLEAMQAGTPVVTSAR